MRIALDTNRYSDYIFGQINARTIVNSASEIYMAVVVIGELRFGFLHGSHAEKNEANLSRFLNSDRVHLLMPDEMTTHLYAKLRLQLRHQGTPIPIHDIWLGALCVQHDLILATRDRHFEHLPQIPRL